MQNNTNRTAVEGGGEVKYSYRLEVQLENGKWFKLWEAPLEYCRGYLRAKSDYSPRLAHQIVRSDGKIIQSLEAREDVSIGMIAGWPTPEQYESAAKRALDQAQSIRENPNHPSKRLTSSAS